MAVFVDDMYLYPMGEYKRGGRVYKMSHMIADTTYELVLMIRTIGVGERYIQHKGTPAEHYDIAISKRVLALENGAVPITLRQCSAMRRRRQVEGILGKPAEAEAWYDAYLLAKKVTAR